jgi:hypothetical protein
MEKYFIKSEERLNIQNIRRIKEKINNASYKGVSEGIRVKLWLQELRGCCATFLLDEFLSDQVSPKGIIYCFTGEKSSAADYISVLTLDGLSSGVRVLDRFDYEDEGILTLEVNSLLLKKVITVPKNPMDGFPWSFNSEQYYIIKSDLLPTIDFGFHYVLNFAVCGEFNLSLWYVPEGTEEPRHMLSTGFCCK